MRFIPRNRLRRAPLISALVAGGLLLGFVSASAVEWFDLNPLVAPFICAAGAVALGLIRRKHDFPEFLAESAIFTYSAVVGMIVVRATPGSHLRHGRLDDFAGWVNSPNLVVLLAGLGLALGMVCLLCVPAWALAQGLDRRRPDERDRRFLDYIARARSRE